MKLAILGTRGVPPNYGGFETFAGELSTRLVARGHDVTIYCRSQNGPSERELPVWNGVRRIVLPAVGHKYFETVSHTFLSALDCWNRDFDSVLLCNAANAFVIPILRAARIPVAINVDGIERKRRKWNALGRAVYASGEAFSVAFASVVVADAKVIADYYRTHYGLDPVTIPYGAEFPEEEDSDVLRRLGLEPRGYVLYVSRFEPENNPLEVVNAYERLSLSRAKRGISGAVATVDHVVETAPVIPRFARRRDELEVPLVMLGEGLYAQDLVDELKAHQSETVLFPGALYGRDYRTLQRNALIYIQATEVGGTHPALIEAMGSGGCVLALDTPENREVGGEAAGYFRLGVDETLSPSLRQLLDSPDHRESLRHAGRLRARERFSWEHVVDAYEQLLAGLSR